MAGESVSSSNNIGYIKIKTSFYERHIEYNCPSV